MRKITRKILQFVLVFCILSGCYGCNNTNNNKLESESKQYENNIYLEEKINIPNIGIVYDINIVNKKEIILVTEDNEENIKIYSSEDYGKQWREKELKGYMGKDKLYIYIAISNNGDIAYIYCDKNNINWEELELKASILKSNGSLIDFEISTPEEIIGFKYNSNGDIVQTGINDIIIYDGKSGKIKEKYESQEEIINSAVLEKSLIVQTTEAFNKVELEKKKISIEVEGLRNFFDEYSAIYEKDGIFYIANSNGLVKYDTINEEVSKIINSNNTLLGKSHMYVGNLLAINEENIIVAYRGVGTEPPSIYKYTYSEELSNKELENLNVYSLYYDEFIEQSIIEYNRNNPQIKINYEIGVTGEDGKNESDAIKILNTEIVAGAGPDVIFLDDINYEEYIEKGVLEDIKEIIENKKDNLFKNIVNCYTQDEGIYAIPIRIKVPTIMADKDIIKKNNNYDSILDFIANELNSKEENVMAIYTPGDIINLMFYIFSDEWINDKEINKTAIMEFLNSSKEIYNLIVNKIESDIENYNNAMEDLSYIQQKELAMEQFLCKTIDPMQLSNPNYNLIEIGYITSIEDFVNMYTFIDDNNQLDYINIQKKNSNLFLPQKIVSINSYGENKEIAKNFVSKLLEKEYQEFDNYSGLPINKEALDNLYIKNIGNDNLGAFIIERGDFSKRYDRKWPTEGEYNKFFQIINNLNLRANTNKEILEIMVQVGEKYIMGEYTIEEALEKIVDSMEIRLNE